MNRVKSITKSFVEQGISSLGSFLFFFTLARWLKSERFGQFSAVWISIQVMTSIAMAWIYLPVTSMAVPREEETAFYGVCFQRMLKLFFLIPVLLFLALYITAKEILALPLVLITTVSLCIVIMTVDFLRYYLIRRGHKMGAALLVVVRWAGGISLVLLLCRMQILTVGNAIFCMLSGNIFALLITTFTVKRLQCNIDLTSNKELNYTLTKFSKPLLFQALSGSASGVIVAFAMRSWLSTAVFGAYQALRSICNIVSPLMQIINTHYSSYLTRKSGFKQHYFIEYLLIFVGGLLVYISWFFKDCITKNTIGPSYLNYSFLLPVIMFHTFILLTNNLVGARIRRSGNTQVFIYSGLIGLLSSIVLIPTAKCTGSIQMVVFVIVLGAVIQFAMLKAKSLSHLSLFKKGIGA